MDKEEAIKILRELHDKALFSERTALETLHPELKESEDERIRKGIKSILEHYKESGEVVCPYSFVLIDEALAWLEKQGTSYTKRDVDDAYLKGISDAKNELEKQGGQKPQRMISAEAKEAMYDKPADKIEPKFKVGDWIVDTLYDKAMQVLFLEDDGYEFENGIWISYTDAKERVHLWTIQDAKPGDVLYCESSGIEYIVMNKGINKCNNIDSYFRYNSINGFGIDIPSVLSAKCDSITPATKEQRDLLFSKMKEAGYEWDSEKKEFKKIELSDVGHEYYSELLKNDTSDNIADYAYQCVYCMSHDWAIENPTWDNVQSACRLGAKWQKKHDVSEDWSEEDEKMIGRVRGIIEAYAFSQSAVDVNGDLCEKKFIDVDIWLKSLKDRVKSQNTWKPSSELDEASYQVGIKRVLENPESYGLTKYNWNPSDEQMDALYEETQKSDRIRDDRIVSLYNDLKKLKGE